MTTPAIEDFDTIARNRKRINDEQTWRAKDAGYGDTAPAVHTGHPNLTETHPGWRYDPKLWKVVRCNTCSAPVTDPDGNCDGGCLAG